ncbi:MAG: Ig-like domain-containing protein [Thermoplasmatota archaeon]
MIERGTKRIIPIVLVLVLSLTAFIGIADEEHPGGTRASYPYPAKVHLELKFADENPAALFTVYLQNYEEGEYNRKTFKTDTNGEVDFEVTAFDWGPCRLWANDSMLENWWTDDLFVEPNGNYSINGTVYPVLTWDNNLHGIVKNSENGLPLSAVDVSVEGYDLRGRPIFSSMTTGLDGEYSFPLPDSNMPFDLLATAPGLNDYRAEVYLTLDSNDVVVDLWMGASYVPDTTLGVKGVNTTSGYEFEMEYVSLYGTNAEADHTYFSGYTYAPNTTTGYYEIPVGFGEYEVRLNTYPDPVLNVSFEMYSYLVVNDTDKFEEVQMPIPTEWRRVDVHLEDSSGPIYYAYADYDLYLGDFRISGDTHTDTAGNAELYIPAETDVDLRLWSYSHDSLYVDIEAGPSSSPVTVDEVLEPWSSSGPPTGQVSILVKDEVSGLPIPLVSISGSAYDSEGEYWIQMYGTTGPDGYMNKTVDAGFYPMIRLSSNLGTGTIENFTVYETALSEITGYTKRRDFPPEPVAIEFDLVTATGDPVPDHPVSLSGISGFYAEHEPISDHQGRVRVWVVPGDYRIWMSQEYSCIRGCRASWAMKEVEVTVSTGGTLQDVVLHPTKPLGSIEGFIKDSVSGQIIPQQWVSASSYHDLDVGPTRQLPYVMGYFEALHDEDEDRLYYFWEGSSGSDDSGFYRVWGGNNVALYADREGYYHYDYELDLSTRADMDHDILMEPIPEYTTFVNGTLVDQDSEPLEGIVALLDVPHDNYHLDNMMVNTTGEFSLECYPGQLRALFGNETLWDYVDIEVPAEGIEDLMLVLAPSTFINGTVVNGNDDPLQDINVTLVDASVEPENVVQWMMTGADGAFSFPVRKGTYRLVIQDTEEYYGFAGDKIVTMGWVPIHVDIQLLNRTSGTLFGRITGSGGPLSGGIPGALIKLHHPVIETEANVTTDLQGDYIFDDVPYATNWTIEVTPPMLYTGIVDVRSGYLPRVIQNVTFSEWMTEMNFVLPYIEVDDVELVNVTAWGPKGENVGLNDVIWIQFSHEMDKASVEAAVETDPSIIVTRMSWNPDGTRIIIQHDDFQPETNYTVKVEGTVLSLAGMPMWDIGGFQWTFRTGTELLDWYIDSVEIYVSADRTVDIEVTGGQGIDIHFVVASIGSFEMEEGAPGVYTATINGTLLDWSTTYEYHFSDTEDGPDKWPSLSGTFTTPDEPIPSDDDDVDDDTDDDIVDDDVADDDEESKWSAVGIGFAICGILLLVILTIAVILFIVMRPKPEKWEEE